MEKLKKKFVWGLGFASNNEAEELGLWQGLKLAIAKGILQLNVFGDFLITNKKCNKLNHCKDPNTRPTLQRIQMIVDKFEILEFYHIKRENYILADDQANTGIDLDKGELMEAANRIYICHIL